MNSLGDSILHDGPLRVNESDPFASFAAGQRSAAITTSNTLTHGPPSLIADTFQEKDNFDPMQTLTASQGNPLMQAGMVDSFYDQPDPLLNQSSVAQTTFQILDGSVDPSQERSLMPFTKSSALGKSWDPAPTRVMPGEHFEEDTDALVLGASLHSPRHHENEEISRLMSELHIDERERHLFSDVAELTLRSDLPPPWKKKFDQSGATYYIDVDNGTSTYSNPLLPYVKPLVEAWRIYLRKPSAKFFESSKEALWRAHAKELKGWHGPLKDAKGQSYFWNSGSRRSTWHDPRLCGQHYFDFQCSLLKHLETRLTATQDTDESPLDASKPPWEMRQTALDTALAASTGIHENQQMMLADQPRPLQALREKAVCTTETNLSNTADLVRGVKEAEENVQRTRLTEKRMQKLDDKKVRDQGRILADAIHENQQLMLTDQPQPLKALCEKPVEANRITETNFLQKDNSFRGANFSNTPDLGRGAVEAEGNVQRATLTKETVHTLEDTRVRDKGRGLAEAIHDPAINSAVFLGTAPLDINDSWIIAAPLEWQIHQPRSHVGWQPWELWTKEV